MEVGTYGALSIERAGSDIDNATEALTRWRHDISLMSQLIQIDVTSIKVRLSLLRGLLVRYLLPPSVIDHIEYHDLYIDDASGYDKKNKEKKWM